MTKQIKHIRISKKGKKFIAGSRKKPQKIEIVDTIYSEFVPYELLEGDRIGDVLIEVDELSDGTYRVKDVCHEGVQDDGYEFDFVFDKKSDALEVAKFLTENWNKKPLPKKYFDKARMYMEKPTRSGLGSPEESFEKGWE